MVAPGFGPDLLPSPKSHVYDNGATPVDELPSNVHGEFNVQFSLPAPPALNSAFRVGSTVVLVEVVEVDVDVDVDVDVVVVAGAVVVVVVLGAVVVVVVGAVVVVVVAGADVVVVATVVGVELGALGLLLHPGMASMAPIASTCQLRCFTLCTPPLRPAEAPKAQSICGR
jgi:hypothetical protein